MAETQVLDTNVLIVASAADDGSPFHPDATPVEEAELRGRVLAWVSAFESDSSRRAVLDWDWHLASEYQNKLTEQDFGWLVLMAKKDRDEVLWIGLALDPNGHAALPSALEASVTDRDDRKMVAAVLAAKSAGYASELVNACDTDWLDCADALDSGGVPVLHLLYDWLVAKWDSKKKGRS